jgi:hypothetical protein
MEVRDHPRVRLTEYTRIDRAIPTLDRAVALRVVRWRYHISLPLPPDHLL